MTSATLKRWPTWVLLLFVIVGFLAVGASRDGGPRTQQERIDAIAKRLACPTCDGESVYESRASASQNVRNQIAREVQAGAATDDEIVAYIQDNFGAQVLIVPRASGIDALVWALPAAAFVCAVAGLAVAFVRWRGAADTIPTDEDRELVAAALRADGGDSG